jgi:DNA-binding MarR family transcriptional regulator
VSKQLAKSKKLKTRQELTGEVAMAVGGFRQASEVVDEAVASAFAINRTDLRVIEAVAVEGRLTAGQLATKVGLSPAATTTAIGRLVNAGYAVRERNEQDLRQTVVALTPQAMELGERTFGVMVKQGREMLERYTRQELLLISDFLRNVRRIELDHAKRLAEEGPLRSTARSKRG